MLANNRSLIVAYSSGVAILALLAVGCGGSSSPRVASIESVSTGASTTATPAAKLAAYYQCMAAHGFPNYRMPTILKGSAWGAAKIKLTPAQARNINSPGFHAADDKCADLIPGEGSGLSPAREAAARSQARRFSQCARSHGMPNFPDPNTSIGAIDLSAAGIDPESPAFLHAKQECRSLFHDFSFLVGPPG